MEIIEVIKDRNLIQKELDRLADIEEAAFYAYYADRDNPELKAAHEKAKAELIAYFIANKG